MKQQTIGSFKGTNLIQYGRRPDVTQFSEQTTATKNRIISISSTYGVSSIRDTTFPADGSGITGEDGEIKLTTDAETDSVKRLQTNYRGEYRAGSEAEIGIGVRIPVIPTGSQSIEWGYFDDSNGFGFGVDSVGQFLFILSDGTKEKIYKEDWENKTEEVDLTDGSIYHINFTWYGYGAIRFSIFKKDTYEINKIELHNIVIKERVSILDPNQPITVEIKNGATSSGSLSVYVGGRQFSRIGGSDPMIGGSRPVSETLVNYAIVAAQDVWEPVLAFRKRPIFRGKNNSINVDFEDLVINVDNDIVFMVTIGGTTTGTPATWSNPTLWDANESSTEVKLSIAGSLSTSTVGNPILMSAVFADKNSPVSLSKELNKIFLGENQEIIVFVKKITAQATNLNLTARWNEFW